MSPMIQSMVETALVHAEVADDRRPSWPSESCARWPTGCCAVFGRRGCLEQGETSRAPGQGVGAAGPEAQEDIAAAAKLHESQQTTLVEGAGRAHRQDPREDRRGPCQSPRHRDEDRRHRLCHLPVRLRLRGRLRAGKPAGACDTGGWRGSGEVPERMPDGLHCCGEDKCCERKTAPSANKAHIRLGLLQLRRHRTAWLQLPHGGLSLMRHRRVHRAFSLGLRRGTV